MTNRPDDADMRRMAEALARSERLRAEVERIAQVGSWEWDIASNRITWSAELYRVFGMAPQDFDPTYEAYVARLLPDDRERVAANVRHAMETGEPFSHTHGVVHPDGSVHTVLGRGEVIRDANGQAARMVGTAQDITVRVALERETAARQNAERARERAEFLERVGHTLAGITTDYEATFAEVARLAVPSAADWCAVDLLEPDGSLRRVAVHHRDPAMVEFVNELTERYPDDRTSPYGAYEVSRTGIAQRGEVTEEILAAIEQDAEHGRLIRALGLRSYVVAPLVGRDGVIGVITFVNDTSRPELAAEDLTLGEDIGRRAGLAIDNARLFRAVLDARERLEQQARELEAQTSQLQEMAAETEAANEELRTTGEELMLRTEEAESALREAESARKEAESANSAKADFLATMSHELRTPINAALGYSDLLSMGVRGPVNAAQLEDIGRIQRSQRLLLSLVNDILNFARLEAGQVEFRLSGVKVTDVLEAMDTMIAPQMTAKSLRYVQHACGDDLAVCADSEKLQQVLLNLLTNAIKFTDAGGEIEIVCGEDDGWVEIAVRDTGRGIAADQLERVFEPFVQVDRHLTHASQQGVGLGLAISRDLMRGMGGDLRVTSEPGAGSTFAARLPRASSTEASAEC